MSESASPPRPPSLYEWAGGKAALEKLTAIFYGKVFQEQASAQRVHQARRGKFSN